MARGGPGKPSDAAAWDHDRVVSDSGRPGAVDGGRLAYEPTAGFILLDCSRKMNGSSFFRITSSVTTISRISV